jgi:hypothetical protein
MGFSGAGVNRDEISCGRRQRFSRPLQGDGQRTASPKLYVRDLYRPDLHWA